MIYFLELLEEGNLSIVDKMTGPQQILHLEVPGQWVLILYTHDFCDLLRYTLLHFVTFPLIDLSCDLSFSLHPPDSPDQYDQVRHQLCHVTSCDIIFPPFCECSGRMPGGYCRTSPKEFPRHGGNM